MIEDKILKTLKGDPMSFILKTADPEGVCVINWNRYLPFFRHDAYWVPYHKTYCALWAAKKWGCNGYGSDTEHFIMDLTNGEIVWNDWETENE